MVIEESIHINADAKRVWEIFSDFSCWQNWCTAVTDVGAAACGTLAPGSTVRFCMRPFSLPISISPSIDEVSAYEKIVWSGRKFGIRATHEFSFVRRGAGVEVVSREVFGGLLVRLFPFLVPFGRLHAATALLLRELKSEAEREEGGG